MPASSLQWLAWARELQAIAQTGLTYCKEPFDIERYEAVREIAAQILAANSQVEMQYVRDLFAAEKGHATPKVGVRSVVFQNDKILLVRERQEGLWTLPGGWVDINESASEATVRETLEETGFQTRVVKLLALYDRNKHDHPPHPSHAYNIFILCELMGGKPTYSYEIDGIDFFTEDDLPPLSTMRVNQAQIKRMFEHYRHPAWPTDFD